jgi:tetratricopeptide (TPR) repeat protein
MPTKKTGLCESCGKSFGYRLIHSGFNETIYAYCDRCGLLLLLSTFDERAGPQRTGKDWARAVNEWIEPLLPTCECGGHFSGAASPRCPSCSHPLNARAATTWIEANAGANSKRQGAWQWQACWTGLYCISIDGRFREEPPTARSLMERASRARRENRPADAYRDLVSAVAMSRELEAKARRAGEKTHACAARKQAGASSSALVTAARRVLVKALKALGQIERDLGNREAALPLYEEAVALCRKDDDLLALAHTVRHVGDIDREAGRADVAEPCYLEALAIYRGHAQTEPLDLANAIRPLAILRDEAGAVEEAKRLWTEARDLYAAVKVAPGVAECSARLARLEGGAHG